MRLHQGSTHWHSYLGSLLKRSLSLKLQYNCKGIMSSSSSDFITTAVEILELIQYLIQIYFEALCYAASPIVCPSVIDYMTKGEGFNYYVFNEEDLMDCLNSCPTVDSAIKATSKIFERLKRPSSYNIFTKSPPMDDFCFGIID